MQTIKEIELTPESVEELFDHIKNNQPLVLKLPEIIPCADWSLDKLSSLIGNEKQVLYELEANGNASSRADMIIHKKTFNEIHKILLGKTGKRYQMVSNIKNNPILHPLTTLPPALFKDLFEKMLQINLWVNHGHFESGLHFDCINNLNLQVSGEKKFILFEPGLKNYYPNSVWSGKGHTSKVINPNDYDQEKFKLFNAMNDNRYEVTLKPGMMLYLPYCWWHYVISGSNDNINVNYWWLQYTRSLSFPVQASSGIITVIRRMLTGKLY